MLSIVAGTAIEGRTSINPATDLTLIEFLRAGAIHGSVGGGGGDTVGEGEQVEDALSFAIVIEVDTRELSFGFAAIC